MHPTDVIWHPFFAHIEPRQNQISLYNPSGLRPETDLSLADAVLVINAPLDYQLPEHNANWVLFIDPKGTERELINNAYQVSPIEAIEPQAFNAWAQNACHMLQAPFLNNYLMGLDLADLRELLKGCSTKQLGLQIISYTDADQPPVEALKPLRFEHVFFCLYYDERLTLEQYSELGNVLELIVHEQGRVKAGTSLQHSPLPQVLLLGEVRP